MDALYCIKCVAGDAVASDILWIRLSLLHGPMDYQCTRSQLHEHALMILRLGIQFILASNSATNIVAQGLSWVVDRLVIKISAVVETRRLIRCTRKAAIWLCPDNTLALLAFIANLICSRLQIDISNCLCGSDWGQETSEILPGALRDFSQFSRLMLRQNLTFPTNIFIQIIFPSLFSGILPFGAL